jgi:hypothetical protein
MSFFLKKENTGSSPEVLIDEEKQFMRIAGESFHENTIEFFKEINDWLEGYLKSEFGAFTFECDMKYFNSSTAKLLLNMLLHMDASAAPGKKITVNWITTADNDIIIECGEDFKNEMSHLEFNLIIN